MENNAIVKFIYEDGMLECILVLIQCQLASWNGGQRVNELALFQEGPFHVAPCSLNMGLHCSRESWTVGHPRHLLCHFFYNTWEYGFHTVVICQWYSSKDSEPLGIWVMPPILWCGTDNTCKYVQQQGHALPCSMFKRVFDSRSSHDSCHCGSLPSKSSIQQDLYYSKDLTSLQLTWATVSNVALQNEARVWYKMWYMWVLFICGITWATCVYVWYKV